VRDSERIEIEAELSALARLLSLGLGVPDEESLEEIGALARGLAARPAVAEDLRETLAELAALLEADGLAESLPAEFGRLFDGRVLCSPHESSYEGDPFRSQRELADVAGFYRAFGAEASGPAAERPDHAGAELEFLSFLAAKRLAALAEGKNELAATCGDVEDAFLRDHLGRWIPTFCRRLLAEAESPYYALLAVLAERTIVGELARRGLSSSQLGPLRRWSVEEDEIECGTSDLTAPA
jgi:TorA maturation chaperone TorD